MVDDELDDAPEPEPYDPTRGMRRLAQAIVLQALIDFTRKAENRGVWSDASRFLFPVDPDQQEFLRWTTEVSGLDPYRLRKNLTRMVDEWSYRASHSDASRFRHCLKCKSPFPPDQMAGRYCTQCRASTPRYPKQVEGALRRQARLRSAAG